MHRSSDTIGAIGAALAKAQGGLINPEKALTATIRPNIPGEGERTFRYASLATGLDIVRKCLGQHEIATVQTTAIDKDSGMIRLTTTLVHASGEWVSSDWPVCPVSETAAPHRLGAALSYARRYALFTLVGIAGEDDLDAPDLSGNAISAENQNSASGPERAAQLHQPSTAPKSNTSMQPERRARAERVKPAILPPEASKTLQDQLISELSLIGETEALATWAHRVLPFKNQLSKGDAQRVEAAFADKLDELGETTPLRRPQGRKTKSHQSQSGEANFDADGVITISKPVRERDRDHLRFVATQPCLVCGRTPSDAHHIKFAEAQAMGRKVSDKFAVPLCRLHHRELHRRGNERTWWENQGIDPLSIAASLWKTSHKVESAATENAGHFEMPTTLDGRRPSNGPAQPQNNETNPIVGPEAG